ncbi:MAG: ABC transporter substrate-binding protein [Polyangiaceae bacterium]|nr:ABC transporter substrate-binding protein [Polyangiaceae bacterium]
MPGQIPVSTEEPQAVLGEGLPAMSIFRFLSLPAKPNGARSRRIPCFLVGSLVALSLLATSCKKSSAPQRQPGTAIVVPTQRATWIRNFNPFFESQARWPSTAGIYEPLIIFNRATGEFIPWLATSYRFENENRELVLRIRKGVYFADGVELTPDDVLFTFRLMKKYRALDSFAVWNYVEKVEKVNDEIRFRFQRPFTTPGLFIIGRQPIVPEHLWKDVEDPVKYSDPNPVGTGPFNQILSFQSQIYEVGANPNYWQEGKPGLKKLRLPAFGGNEAMALAIIRGEVDWSAAFIPSIDRVFVKKDPEHRGYYFPSLEGTVMLYANTTKPPYDDVRVRKALSHAIDRERIVRIAMQGYTRPANATGFSDLYNNWFDEKVLAEEGDFTRFDPSKARSLLDEAGLKMGSDGFRTLPDGSPLEVDLNCVVGWSDWIIAAQIMVRDLRAIGVDATLRTYAFGAWFQKLQLGEFDLSISWSDGSATPWSFYQRQMSASTVEPVGKPAENNWQRYSNPKADALLDVFASSSDPQEQRKAASELQREFVRNAPAIPLFPGPTWGQFNTTAVEGFPSKENPYAPLAPYKAPGQLLAMVELRPTGTPALPGQPGGPPPQKGGTRSWGPAQPKTANNVIPLEKTSEEQAPEKELSQQLQEAEGTRP